MIARKISLRAVMEGPNPFEDWALEAVLEAVDAASAMQAKWGPRCPDFDAGCPACKAWASFDASRKRK